MCSARANTSGSIRSRCGLEHRRRHVAQRGDRRVALRDHGDGGLALRPALVVGRGLEPARRARVAHDERHVVERERDRAMLERAAVEEQGAPLLAERGRELVHEAAVHADVAVLGPLRGLRERHPVERRQRAPDERERRRELERGRARQACAGGACHRRVRHCYVFPAERHQFPGCFDQPHFPPLGGVRRAIASPQRTALVVELREGVRFLLSKRELTVAIIVLLGNGAFVYSTSTIIPLIAEDALHVGASEFGLLVAAVGLGSLFAALVVARRARASEKTFLIAAACFGLLYLSLAVVSWFAVAFVVLVLVGAAIQVFGTSVNSLLQLNSPDHLRGRVMSVFTLLTNGIQPAGSLLNGVVTAAAGVRLTIAVEAIICLTALVAALIYRARTQPGPGGESALPT